MSKRRRIPCPSCGEPMVPECKTTRRIHLMTTTPAGVQLIARRPDGSEVDVTEGVQVLYDHVIGSMDWGSGFLTVEDAIPIAEIARVCGFKECEEAERYIAAQRHAEERQEYWRRHPEAGYGMWHDPQPHEHVWSSAGRCMWRTCNAVRESE